MMAAATPTAAQGGHTILLKVVEVVPHDGFYRVALSINSRTEIPPDNTVYDASGKVLPSSGLGPDGKPLTGSSNKADSESPAVFPVLADNLFPHAGAGVVTYMQEIMLPNVNCDHCTMQILEFMHPHGYNGTPGKNDGGGYFYHHCADLKITADPTMPLFVAPGADGGAPDAASGDAKQDSSASGAGGATGAAGSTGTAGAGGSGSTGAAGSTASGSGGSNGAAGTTGAAGTSGAAGSTGAAGATGAAGSTGAGGSTPRQSSGGCSYAADLTGSASATLMLLLVMAFARPRRRRRAE